MCSAVCLLSLLVAMDPVRIGITALLLSRQRPMVNLLVFWLGGMAAGIVTALVVLLFLRDYADSVIQQVISVFSSPTAAYIHVAVGALAMLIAARMWARQRAPVPVPAGGSSVLVMERDEPSTSSRLSIRGLLDGGSLAMPFVAGLALATPPVEYLAALIAILASGTTVGEQFAAALMFTLIAFTVVETPLVTYLVAPVKTLAAVQRLNDWIGARRQAIPAVVLGVFGVLLVLTGIGKL